MSLSDNYPDIRPVWMNDYSNAGVIDPRCSFTRSDSTPSNVHYWSDEDHLSSENFLLQSQGFDTTWGTGPGHLTGTPSGGQTAPDGTSTAFIATATTSASSLTPYVNQPIALSASTTYTMVGHLKAGTASHGFIAFRGSNGNSAYAMVNFSGGTVSHGSYGDFTSPSSSVTALGSSWFRVTLTATTGTSLSSQVVVIGISDGTAPSSAGYASYVPNGETIYLWGAQLSSTQTKVYDSPTTTQIHREYAATLKSVAYSGQPRFEYEPTGDHEARGLLIEGQGSNIMPFSTNGYNASNAFQFTTTYGITTTENAAVSPSGSLDAALITEDTSTGSHQWQVTPTVVAGKNTISVYVKPIGGADYFGIRVADVNTYGAIYTFSTLSYTNYGVAPEETRIETLSNGWYRVSITQTLNAGARLIRFNLVGAGGNASYAGNGYNGCLTYGYQCEANAFPSSWVDTGTSGSTSSRTADSLSMTDSSLFDNGGGTLYAEASRNAILTYNGIFSVDDGSGSNIVQMFGNSNNFRSEIASGGTTVANMSAAGHTAKTFHKHCVSFSPTEAKYYVNGSQIGSTDTDLNIPSMSQIHLGVLNTSGNHLNGHIKRVALYSEALTDTELQSLTS